jgi:hypothetical protein
MKLNPDCIRDILLTVEENTGYQQFMSYPGKGVYPFLSKYSEDEVYYHIYQCKDSGFFRDLKTFLGGSLLITDLSPFGHEFLANIRQDTNWQKVKDTAKKVGSTSLSAIAQIAAGVIQGLISGL